MSPNGKTYIVGAYEGPIVLSNVVDCDFAEVRIGQKARVVFRGGPSGRATPFFSPASSQGAGA
jgi:uncharacterized OB-fold protein